LVVGPAWRDSAVTGAYVMILNHLGEQIEVKKFLKKYFGHVEGLRNLYIDEPNLKSNIYGN